MKAIFVIFLLLYRTHCEEWEEGEEQVAKDMMDIACANQDNCEPGGNAGSGSAKGQANRIKASNIAQKAALEAKAAQDAQQQAGQQAAHQVKEQLAEKALEAAKAAEAALAGKAYYIYYTIYSYHYEYRLYLK